MKKLLVTTAATLLAVAAFAQGTVYFSNGAFNKISLNDGTTTSLVPTTAGLINYGLFYGTGATKPATLTFLGIAGVNSTVSAGIIAAADGSVVTALPITGTQPNDANVWVQIAGWSASAGTDWAAAPYFGATAVVNAANLGPSTGPGAALWQTASGTDPKKFAGGFVISAVPEPTTMALAGLGLAALLFRRRK